MDPGLRCGVQLEHAARISLLDHRSDRRTLLDGDLGTRGAARDRSLDHRLEESRFAAKCPIDSLDGNGRSPGDSVHRGTRVPPLHKGVERCLEHVLAGLSRLRPPPFGVVAARLDTSLIRWNTHASNTASLTRILSAGQRKGHWRKAKGGFDVRCGCAVEGGCDARTRKWGTCGGKRPPSGQAGSWDRF